MTNIVVFMTAHICLRFIKAIYYGKSDLIQKTSFFEFEKLVFLSSFFVLTGQQFRKHRQGKWHKN